MGTGLRGPYHRAMTSLEEMDRRVRVLAGGADRDSSELRAELRAHTKVLNALRETQLEEGQAVTDGFAQVDEKFATMALGIAQIHGLLERIALPTAD